MPPPEFAFVVFVPDVRVAGQLPRRAAEPAALEEGDSLVEAPDPAEAEPVVSGESETAEIARWLGPGLAAALHTSGRYHTVELGDLPDIAASSAQGIWDDCVDLVGCMTLLGDRARARISLSVELSPPRDGVLPAKVHIYDLDWGEEVEGLTLRLPWPEPVEEPIPLAADGVEPTPSESIASAPTRQDALDALVMAIDARLLPLVVNSERVRAGNAAVAPAPASVDQAAKDAALEAQLDDLASKIVEGGDDTSRYDRGGAQALGLDDDEREMLGMTAEQYLHYKQGGWTQAQWRRRNQGRTGEIAVRVGGGVGAGELSQTYDGTILMGQVTTEVLEKYARLAPAHGSSMFANLGLAVGVLPDAEFEARVGFGQSLSEVHTLQTFAETYPCAAGPTCPKVENIATRIVTGETLARLYARRPWLFRPYLTAGALVMRLQDVPDAYASFSSTAFPAAFDAFPALWAVHLTGTPGFTYELAPGVHVYAELPLQLRVWNNDYDALHYHSAEPQVSEPVDSRGLPGVVSLRVGLHVRLRDPS